MVERKQSTRKNIMREFTISELSAVDRPAQAHATMAIMKRYTDDEQENNMRLEKINGEQVVSFTTLQEAMAHLQKINGLSKSDAMSKAAREHPDLLAKYQSEGERSVAKAADERLTIMRRPPAVQEFEALIRRIKDRDGCDSVTALRRARSEDPSLFAQYQAA